MPFKSLISSPRFQEFIKYGLGSAAALGVDVVALIVLTELFAVPYLWSAGLGFLAGLVTIYAISVLWVFETRAVENRAHEFLIFSVIGLLGLGLNQVSIYTITEIAGVNYLIAKFLTVGLVFMFNFFARQTLLFHQTTKTEPKPQTL